MASEAGTYRDLNAHLSGYFQRGELQLIERTQLPHLGFVIHFYTPLTRKKCAVCQSPHKPRPLWIFCGDVFLWQVGSQSQGFSQGGQGRALGWPRIGKVPHLGSSLSGVGVLQAMP